MKHFHSKELFLDYFTFPKESPSRLQFILFASLPKGEFYCDFKKGKTSRPPHPQHFFPDIFTLLTPNVLILIVQTWHVSVRNKLLEVEKKKKKDVEEISNGRTGEQRRDSCCLESLQQTQHDGV